jgi:RHS repeat-associated protein
VQPNVVERWATRPAYYRHTDWLGSSRLTSTASRTVYSDSAYAPFGEQYSLYGTSDPSFTGQNADTSSTLYDFPLREYSPSQGRWISPDPAGTLAVDPTNPQSWNRYAYVQNMPLNSIDPLGLYCDLQQEAEGCGRGNTFFNEEGSGGGVDATFGEEDFAGGFTICCASMIDDNGDPIFEYYSDPGGWYNETGTFGGFIPPGTSANTSEPPISQYIKGLLFRPWSFGILLPLAEIPVGIAGNLSFDLDKGFVCLGVGFGVGARGVNGGPLWGGTQNSYSILSGLSVSGNLAGPIGGQVIENPSGRLYGPTVGAPGASLTITYSGCAGK